MQEVWKDIKGYEGLYQVSNLGNVRSYDRFVIGGRYLAQRKIAGKVLNPWDNGSGYLVVSLHNKHKRENRYVHRLVAAAFLEKQPTKNEVNHIDYNKHNNAVSNLEWCTRQENTDHSVEHMRKPKSKCKETKTGYKYIHKKGDLYRVQIGRGKIIVSRTFHTIEDALEFRNGLGVM